MKFLEQIIIARYFNMRNFEKIAQQILQALNSHKHNIHMPKIFFFSF